MLDAKLLATYGLSDGPYSVYGVWIPRRGDNLRLTCEVVTNFQTYLTARIYQKNYNEAGDGSATAPLASFPATTGRQTLEVIGVKELVRVQLGISADPAEGTGVGFALYRILQPVWFESVEV